MKKLYDCLRSVEVKRWLPSIFLQFTIAIFLILFSLISARSEKTTDKCFTNNNEIFSMLPGRIGDYEKAATFKSFSSSNLFDYMNGNAPYYFDHGFACLGVQEYRKDKKALLLELYQFTTRNGARQICLDETADNKNKLDIGEDGSCENCYIAFYLKNYFTKIICFDEWRGNGAESEGQHNTSMNRLVELAKSLEKVLTERTGENLISNKKEKIVSKGLYKEYNRIILIGASYAKGWSLDEIAGMTVINKGISGEQSFEMLSRFQKDVLSLKPTAVIIWGFINDIHRSKRENIDAAIARAKKSFEEMVTLSKENGIIPILATEVTVRAKDSWKETLAGWVGGLLGKESYQDYVNQHVIDVNQWIRDYAEQHDLLLLDLHPFISDENGRRKKECAVKDGSHISQKGYEKLTEYAQGVLKHHFAEP